MSPLKIVCPQPGAATPQPDTPSGDSDSESDFGPILQAATASPASASMPMASQRAPRDHRGGASHRDHGGLAAPDQAPAETDRAKARRTGRGAKLEQLPDADAIAAACAAAGSAPTRTGLTPVAGAGNAAEATRAGAKAATADSVTSNGASGEASDSDHCAIEALGVAVAAASDVPSTAQDVAKDTEGSALRLAVGAKAGALLDTGHAADVRAPRPQIAAPGTDRAETDARSAPIQSDDSLDDPGIEQASVDSDPSGRLASTLAQASGAAARQSVQAFAHSLPGEVLPGGSEAATSQSNTTSGATSLTDPASATAASVGGVFGNVTPYPAEVRASVATPVGQPGFGQELSERVLVLARAGAHTAQISLEPAGLGPVGVAIQIHGHAATLAFTASHEATRHALEAALPRLREMFAACGIQLSDATVGGRDQPQWSGPPRAQSSSGQQAAGHTDAVAVSLVEPPAAARTAVARLVDTYA
jgi:flagellar hook-length control protein FliK